MCASKLVTFASLRCKKVIELLIHVGGANQRQIQGQLSLEGAEEEEIAKIAGTVSIFINCTWRSLFVDLRSGKEF